MADKGKEKETAESLAGLSLTGKNPSPCAPAPAPRQPPRPSAPPPPPEGDDDDFEEEDENDPFADRNALTTSIVENREPVWRTV